MVNGRFLSAAVAGLILLLAVGSWLFWRHPRPGLLAKSSVAVLPFANLAGDEATGRLADGLTEDIITDLSRYRTIDVIAHNSTEAYKGKAVDVRQVGRDLNVRYVLEGSVQREGDQIRVTAQLIDAASDAHLWSERWDRPSKEFFAVQNDIADQLGSRLGGFGVIDKAEQEVARRSRPENLTAYELYLAGRSEVVQSTPESNKKAIELFEKAVAADPRLARAWAELSGALQQSMTFGADPGVPFQRRSPPRGAPSRLIRATQWPTHSSPLTSECKETLPPAKQNSIPRCGSIPETPRSSRSIQPGRRLSDARSAARRPQIMRSGSIRTITHGKRGTSLTHISAPVDFEDTLRIVERLPKENYNFYSWVLRGASYAALGKSAEAKAAVSDALRISRT